MDVFVTVVLILALLGLAYLFLNSGKWSGNLPPGPRPFPVIGNVLQLWGKDFRQVCKEYRKTYGDIFTLHMFNETLIIVNGFEAIKDVCSKNSPFHDKGVLDAITDVVKGNGVAFSNGEIWKHNRRFFIRTLRDFGMGKSKLQDRIHGEISYFLEALEKEGGKQFDIEYLCKIAVSNIVCAIAFGERFDYRDEEFLNIIRRGSEIFESGILVNPYWFRFIPGDLFGVKRGAKNLKAISDYLRTKVQEHYKDFDASNLRDVIGVYIKQMKLGETSDEPPHINEDEIALIVLELFFAGTDTTSSALQFSLMFMLRNPEMQESLASEIRSAVPDNKFPDTNDVRNMPYLQAFISEVLRCGTVIPFSDPRATKVDLQYRGHTFPKSARILMNFESVLYDESLWENPYDLNPSRFTTENRTQSKLEEFIPFGTGPRSCPGESLARMELSLFIAAMVQRFQFLPPEGEGPPSAATRLGVTVQPLPFKFRAIKRI